MKQHIQQALLGQFSKPQKEQKSSDFFCCFSAKKHFQIQEQDIGRRIRASLFLRPPFNEVMESKPDLYGPFWIATTQIVILIASSSLLQFFSNDAAYNFNRISVAGALVYGIAFACPYILAFLVKIFGGVVSVVEIICIYGYSFTSFVPVTALCFLYLPLLQIALLFLGFAISTVFLIRGVFSLVVGLQDKEKYVLGVFIIAMQLLLVFMYKFYFFQLS